MVLTANVGSKLLACNPEQKNFRKRKKKYICALNVKITNVRGVQILRKTYKEFQMSSTDQAVSTIISWTAANENTSIGVLQRRSRIGLFGRGVNQILRLFKDKRHLILPKCLHNSRECATILRRAEIDIKSAPLNC